MPASKRSTAPVSGDGIGATDLARVDAYENAAVDYEELPELTDEMMARAVPGDGLELPKRGRGRPPVENPKQQVTLRLDADVIEAMRASGPGWQVRANEALRQRFKG